MATNTTYNPEKVSDFEKSKLNFAGRSVTGTVNENETVNADYTFTDDTLMTGGVLIVKEAKITDKVSLQVVHPIYGVLNEFVTEYRLAEDQQVQFKLDLPYPAKLLAGLIVRCKYVASEEKGTRIFALNLLLHKVLI
jgi:hypothetical protein